MSRSPKSVEFRRARESAWVELESIVGQAEREGLRALDADDLTRLATLYRATMSSLSVARSISLDRALLAYLEALCARAYLVVYAVRQPFLEAAADFTLRRFPRAVRRHLGALALSLVALVAGVLVAAALTTADPEHFYELVPAQYAQGRDPSTSTAALRETLYDGGGTGGLSAFASFLFSNNARIGILAFAMGFFFGVPTVFLLFVNGLILGAFTALFHSRGLGLDVWAWLLPHGITELLAVALCGAAGLVLAQNLIRPGPHTRLQNLALHGRDAGVIVIGAVVMLFAAALVEGYFRQLVHDVGIRLGVAGLSLAFWVSFFALAGRGQRGADDGREVEP